MDLIYKYANDSQEIWLLFINMKLSSRWHTLHQFSIFSNISFNFFLLIRLHNHLWNSSLLLCSKNAIPIWCWFLCTMHAEKFETFWHPDCRLAVPIAFFRGSLPLETFEQVSIILVLILGPVWPIWFQE